jgi:hypothetical protein
VVTKLGESDQDRWVVMDQDDFGFWICGVGFNAIRDWRDSRFLS